jgi:hypothetical protein
MSVNRTYFSCEEKLLVPKKNCAVSESFDSDSRLAGVYLSHSNWEEAAGFFGDSWIRALAANRASKDRDAPQHICGPRQNTSSGFTHTFSRKSYYRA